MKRNPPPPTDQGNIITVRVDAPAAASEWSTVVPPGRVWRFISGHARFVADANVATRNLRLLVLDGSDVVTYGIPHSGVAASGDVQIGYNPSTYTALAVTAGNYNVALPVYLLLRPGDIITSQSTSLQAGDQYSEINLRVEEWVEA